MAIEMKLKYKISGDEIIVHTSRMLQVFAAIFGIFFVASIGAIFLMSYSLNGEVKLESLWFCLLLFVIFPIMFLAGNRQIIFKRRDETVYKTFGFGRKELARFSDIAGIQYVGNSNCYKIFLKSDPYGKGITITSSITGKEREKFETENLPVLQQMISPSATLPPLPPVELDKLRFYTRKGNIFATKRLGTVLWSFVLTAIALSTFVGAGIIGKQSEFLFVPIPIMLAAIYTGTYRRFFDVSNRTFNVSIAFFYKKKYRIEQFVNFRTVRNTTYGIYGDTSVELVFADEKGKESTVKLIDIRKTRKIERFIAETKVILNL